MPSSIKSLLLLSNSTLQGEPYFNWAKEHVKTFLNERVNEVLFVPFAGVTINWDEYTKLTSTVFKEMGIKLYSIHEETDMVLAVNQAKAIAVGGGNTFQLVKNLHQYDLIEPIRNRVNQGVPYMGWSAGSNVTCPTLCTTNDMPIVEPPSFETLNLIPFQINPHYTEKKIEGHGGESRDQRILEYCEANPDMQVVGLPEGSFLKIQGEQITFHGEWMKLFQKGIEPSKHNDGYCVD